MLHLGSQLVKMMPKLVVCTRILSYSSLTGNPILSDGAVTRISSHARILSYGSLTRNPILSQSSPNTASLTSTDHPSCATTKQKSRCWEPLKLEIYHTCGGQLALSENKDCWVQAAETSKILSMSTRDFGNIYLSRDVSQPTASCFLPVLHILKEGVCL
nr:uncharacterized protein LOC106027109 isoform X2 [Cavia porcellus]